MSRRCEICDKGDVRGNHILRRGQAKKTGGIGQHNPWLRAAVLQGLQFAGILLDDAKNEAAIADGELRLDAAGSATALWAMPTNEELIVARQAVELLSGKEAAVRHEITE